jgi:hypothetical protein
MKLVPNKLAVYQSRDRFFNDAPVYCADDNKGWMVILVGDTNQLQTERIGERMGIWQLDIVKDLKEAKARLTLLAKKKIHWDKVRGSGDKSLDLVLTKLHPKSKGPPHVGRIYLSDGYEAFRNDPYIRSLPPRLRSHFPPLRLLNAKNLPVSIPKIIHQFWIGGEIPAHRKSFMGSVKRLAKRHGFAYKLWGNDELNQATLPFSFGKITQMFDYGSKRGKTPLFSSIVDLMKYEVTCRFGGFTVDTNVEVQNEEVFMKLYEKTKDKVFIGANEDDCGWSCRAEGLPFLSAGFFGSIPNSFVLRNATDPKRVTKINVADGRANITTGPMYLRKCIPGKTTRRVALWPTSAVYPFNPFVDGTSNPCVHAKRRHQSDIPFKDTFFSQPCKAFPKAALMNHWVGGGTWH